MQRAGSCCMTARPTLALSEEATTCILGESAAGFPTETGGILVGCNGTHTIEVVFAVGPGPGAIHQPTFFRRDGDYSQRQLDRLYVGSGGNHDYLGEWHSHPRPGGPSGRDCRSMEWIARHPDYNRAEPVLVLSQRNLRGAWRLLGFRWVAGQLVAMPLTVAGHASSRITLPL